MPWCTHDLKKAQKNTFVNGDMIFFYNDFVAKTKLFARKRNCLLEIIHTDMVDSPFHFSSAFAYKVRWWPPNVYQVPIKVCDWLI